MKRHDPAEHFGEQHVRPKQLADMLNVSMKTARRIIRQSPKALRLPTTGTRRMKRTYESLLLPLSEAKRLYAEMRVSC